MTPKAFIAEMRLFDADVGSSPEVMKMIVQLLEALEEMNEHVQTLLIANKKLLDVIEVLKK